MKVSFEMTDTYGGESNYSWVKRAEHDLPEKTTDRAIVRRAKAWAGWTGHRCKVESYCDNMIQIKPSGICQILFITFDY